MINILITGANGFIGRNLRQRLDVKKINILKYTRENSINDLKNLIVQSDFIYHFAGEVRSNSSDKDFETSNATLTKIIVQILEENNKKVPILLTSSIHAKLPTNTYGKTKRESELIIEKYSKNNNIQCFIYRLPHVFGEGCKVNYNSVISTWMYNSINDLEINCFDNSIGMHYVYVQDIVDDFISKINQKTTKNLYIEPKKIYKTTLGEVVNILNEFKENLQLPDYKPNSSEFKEKLFNVYLDYYRNSNA
jgi:UDP-2-acetamido-2,6-beta-L-arabino-hexul-4-ose reductase